VVEGIKSSEKALTPTCVEVQNAAAAAAVTVAIDIDRLLLRLAATVVPVDVASEDFCIVHAGVLLPERFGMLMLVESILNYMCVCSKGIESFCVPVVELVLGSLEFCTEISAAMIIKIPAP